MLNRFDGNVVPFASEATLTNRTVFGAETQSDDIDDNLNADFKKGWEIVGLNDNPTREDFNAMGYTLGNLISYLYQNGVAEYNALQAYKTNSIAIASDGSIYQSLVDDNIGNALTDATKWIGIASKNSMVNSIDKLKTISNIKAVNVLGYYTKGDGGGGLFYWDSTSTEADNGGTIIQATGVTTGRWKRVFSGAVNVKWFGAVGDGITDDTVTIQNALNISLNVFIPGGIYKTTSPLEIPVLTSFYGEGNGTVIKPTYSSWIGTDYRAIVLETKEGVNYNNRDFGKKISNFSIEGVDSHLVQAIALDFRTKNPDSVTNSTVNWSLYSTFISNLYISRFDTALNIFELWASSFNSIFIIECREAIHIEGQAVNNMLSHIQAVNFTNDYTISTENTIGISISSSNRYNDIDHRPEGFCFDSCLVFGAYNNLMVESCLAFKMSKMILDGGVNTCIVLINPADLIISESYIYTSHTEYIRFEGLPEQQTDSVRIINNNFMGKTLSDVGINFVSSGVSRTNITISGNSFYNFGSPIYANVCPNDSIISNNIATGNLSYSLANPFITVIYGGARTYIDGNRTRENMSIIWTHPANTSPLLEIGNNSSLNQTTRKTGKVTLPAGSTTVEVPVWTYTEQYVRFITSITCSQITNFKYTPESVYMNGVITIPSALGVNAVFSYTTTTIPYTAN